MTDASGVSRFKESKTIVRDILLTKLLNEDLPISIQTTTKCLQRTRDQIRRAYDFRSFLEKTFWFDPSKYDDYAFDIAFEILQKIKTRFIDGYVG
jgi:hypothetical protein